MKLFFLSLNVVKINKQQEFERGNRGYITYNIDRDIHKPHISIMCVYCLMSMCIDGPNKLDYKQTNHKILFQLFLFLVEKRATLPLIFLSSLICLQTAGCISVKFLQIRDVSNTLRIVCEAEPKFR